MPWLGPCTTADYETVVPPVAGLPIFLKQGAGHALLKVGQVSSSRNRFPGFTRK